MEPWRFSAFVMDDFLLAPTGSMTGILASRKYGVVPITASNLRAERMRRMRCWESSVFVVGGGHGYAMVEIMVDDIVLRDCGEGS
jgi:hypothetical protein